jgi:acetyltransferase-like isoleucine patch superfamily enzyme
VLILCRHVEVGSNAKIRFGVWIRSRSFKLGEKSILGYFIHVKGLSDFHVGACCVVGPETIINCDRPVTLAYYSGVGPGCCLFTHGSFLPVTEGYRARFGPIELKTKAWVTMRSTIGPGVTVGEGTNVMPGSVLVESVGAHRLVVGNPAHMVNIPLIRKTSRTKNLPAIGHEILEHYKGWLSEFEDTKLEIVDGCLIVPRRSKYYRIGVDRDAEIVLLSSPEAKRPGMYFNLATLRTDGSRDRVHQKLEAHMRLYFGLTFLDES